MELQAIDLLWLVLLGFAAGVSGGLMGIGGSLVMIPGMVLLFGSAQQHLYQSAAMIANFFVVAPAVVRHWKAGATMRPVIRWTIPCGIIGALVGVYISDLSFFEGGGQGYLQIGFSVFLTYVVFYNIRKLLRRNKVQAAGNTADQKADRVERQYSVPVLIGAVGLPTGMLGGLLGIGGGLYAVPTQQVGLGIPLRNAIANSATTILFLSVFGAIAKNASLSGHGFSVLDSLTLAVCLIPSAMLGSWIAAAKVHQWPVGVIRIAFILLLLYCGARIFLAGWGQVASVG